ncbi:MAG: T9SS type A sorting domain-containing protein [Bacteroidetes bacterium]|nr:T9SS type A sorting domain-containing protein [Bacteroidota bacterium]
MKNIIVSIFLTAFLFFCKNTNAQGTWIPLANLTPVVNGGVMVMLLLSDGTVMAKTDSCRSDSFATATWAKLTPDVNGSYVNGTWTTMTPMHDTRVYFASQVLKDGRVFVAGGEIEGEAPGGDGTGGFSGETYDPLTDSWTMAPAQASYFGDANSEILPNGKVLLAVLSGNAHGTKIFDPVANTWATGPTCFHNHDEAAWVKLADNSILMVDLGNTSSERFIPSLNQWVTDATVPDSLYDPYWLETGAGILLPDGRAFFLGATGHTAIYSPSGNNSPGTWAAGPDIPNSYGTVDAPAAMMMNGKILCCASPQNISSNISGAFLSPTEFFEYDYLTNSFTQILAPAGGDSLNAPCYMSQMLDLPDGSVLYSTQNSSQCYVYVPSGSPLANGKPTINAIVPQNCDTLMITGTLFNGISEGAGYGDDWQMATNYPIVRFTSGTNVFYARTFNWNSTGLQRGSAPDTTYFTLPAGLPLGSYSLAVIANGISSDTITYLNLPCAVGINTINEENNLLIYPNPASANLNIINISGKTILLVYNSLGELVLEKETESDLTLDVSQLPAGVYTMVVNDDEGRVINKIVITK